jgi:hypothetical protein
MKSNTGTGEFVATEKVVMFWLTLFVVSFPSAPRKSVVFACQASPAE